MNRVIHIDFFENKRVRERFKVKTMIWKIGK
jgi:hypothetical protein